MAASSPVSRLVSILEGKLAFSRLSMGNSVGCRIESYYYTRRRHLTACRGLVSVVVTR